MQKITPFLWFNTQAEEAIHFYVDTFAGAPNQTAETKVVSMKRYPNSPLEGPMKGMEGKILTGVFELAGQRFMALDGGPYFQPSGAVSLYIECGSQEEVDYFWDKLTAGGDVASQQCGWLKDKFGFSWQVIPTRLTELLSDSDREKSGRAMQAMIQMKKIVIADLEKAFNG